jgi:hypothetical protein
MVGGVLWLMLVSFALKRVVRDNQHHKGLKLNVRHQLPYAPTMRGEGCAGADIP